MEAQLCEVLRMRYGSSQALARVRKATTRAASMIQRLEVVIVGYRVELLHKFYSSAFVNSEMSDPLAPLLFQASL